MKPTPFNPALATLRSQWTSLDARLSGNLAIWLAVALVLIVLFAGVLPLKRSLAAAEARLPDLEVTRLKMQTQAEEVKRLRALPPTVGSSKPQDLTSLRTQFPGAEVSALGGGRYRVVVGEGRFGAWLAALRTLNGALVLGELNVTRLPGPGERVRIDAVLQPAGTPARSGATP